MPIYEYVCSKCGDHLEVIQKMGDKPLTRCSKCKGKLEKAVSKSSFAFKGSGWYVTDYAKSGSPAPEAKPKADAPAKADKSDSPAKSESPATKSESPAPAAPSTGKAKPD